MNTPPTRFTALRRGTLGQCPRCAHRKIFRSGFRLHERCPGCGLPLEMEDGWSYGSVPLAYGLAGMVWVLPLCLLAAVGWIAFTTALILGALGVIILPIASYRFTKKLWVGLYYAILPQEMGASEPPTADS